MKNITLRTIGSSFFILHSKFFIRLSRRKERRLRALLLLVLDEMRHAHTCEPVARLGWKREAAEELDGDARDVVAARGWLGRGELARRGVELVRPQLHGGRPSAHGALFPRLPPPLRGRKSGVY